MAAPQGSAFDLFDIFRRRGTKATAEEARDAALRLGLDAIKQKLAQEAAKAAKGVRPDAPLPQLGENIFNPLITILELPVFETASRGASNVLADKLKKLQKKIHENNLTKEEMIDYRDQLAVSLRSVQQIRVALLLIGLQTIADDIITILTDLITILEAYIALSSVPVPQREDAKEDVVEETPISLTTGSKWKTQIVPKSNRSYSDSGVYDDATVGWYRPKQELACDRVVSACRGQKGFLLLHAVGSGKSRTSFCIATNTSSTIPITIITPPGLQSAFTEELGKADKYFGPDIVESLKRRITYLEYPQLESYLDLLNKEPLAGTEGRVATDFRKLSQAWGAFLQNRIIIADEAHRLFPLMKRYDTEMKYVFNRNVKVILLTATPIQTDWADLGKMLNILISINKSPVKSTTLSPLVSVNDEQFRAQFYHPTTLSKIASSLYAVTFKAHRDYDLTLYMTAAITHFFPTILASISGGVSGLTSVPVVGILAGPIVSLLAPSGVIATVGATVAPYAAIAAITAVALNSFDNIISIFLNSSKYPIDMDMLVDKVSPYISFFDYKAMEIQHSFEKNDEKRRQIEKDLLPYPVLNVHVVQIPYTRHQVASFFLNTSKGVTPSIAELEMVARLRIENDSVVEGSFISTDNIEELMKALRSIGNMTIDSFMYSTRIVPHRERKQTEMTTDRNNKFNDYNCYEAVDKSDKLITTLGPNFAKVREVYKNWKAPGAHEEPDVKFMCPKFLNALDVIKHARVTYKYLPVIYSNFEKQGMERFSAFLTSLNLFHIVIHKDQSIDKRGELMKEAKKPYERWIAHDIDEESLKIELGFDDAALRRAVSAKLGFDPSYITNEKITSIITQLKRVGNQPVCVIVHPDLQEGLDFALNEVMVCLEPMVGLGNQEQVYGRIVRSIGPPDYATYLEQDGKDEWTDDESINRIMRAQRILSSTIEKYNFFTKTSDYNEKFQQEGGRKRLQKHLIQLQSGLYPLRTEDIKSYWAVVRNSHNWKIWETGVFGFIKPVWTKIMPDTFYTAFFRFPPKTFLETRELVRKHGGGITTKQQDDFLLNIGAYARNFWISTLPAVEINYFIPYSTMYGVFELIYNTMYRGDIVKSPVQYFKQGYVNSGMPTPDLFFMMQLELQQLEYTNMRRGFYQLDSITENNEAAIQKIYESNEYGGKCLNGNNFYRDGDNKPCKTLTQRTILRNDTCNRVGPIAERRVIAALGNASALSRRSSASSRRSSASSRRSSASSRRSSASSRRSPVSRSLRRSARLRSVSARRATTFAASVPKRTTTKRAKTLQSILKRTRVPLTENDGIMKIIGLEGVNVSRLESNKKKVIDDFRSGIALMEEIQEAKREIDKVKGSTPSSKKAKQEAKMKLHDLQVKLYEINSSFLKNRTTLIELARNDAKKQLSPSKVASIIERRKAHNISRKKSLEQRKKEQDVSLKRLKKSIEDARRDAAGVIQRGKLVPQEYGQKQNAEAKEEGWEEWPTIGRPGIHPDNIVPRTPPVARAREGSLSASHKEISRLPTPLGLRRIHKGGSLPLASIPHYNPTEVRTPIQNWKNPDTLGSEFNDIKKLIQPVLGKTEDEIRAMIREMNERGDLKYRGPGKDPRIAKLKGDFEKMYEADYKRDLSAQRKGKKKFEGGGKTRKAVRRSRVYTRKAFYLKR